MLYNIRIKSPKGGLQVILGVNDFDLNRLKESWQKGHEDVTINGTKVYLQNADFIKIYDVSKKIDPTSVSRVQEQVSIYARTMNKGIIDNSVLREYGEDVTAMFIKGGWGEKIEENTVEPLSEDELNEKASSLLQRAVQKEIMKVNNRRYWAGGFGRGNEFYERLEDFKKNNYWDALDYDEDSNQNVAENAWRLFREIKVGDWFIIKGYGGSHTLNVHYIGEVIKITERDNRGRLDFKKLEIPLYRGEAPRGEGGGNWFNTLLEVYRPEDIERIFGIKQPELQEDETPESNPKNDEKTIEQETQMGNTYSQASKANRALTFSQQIVITEDDSPEIGVSELAKIMASMIRSFKDDEIGKMVGIFGDWGRGKTFLMNRIWDVFKDDPTKPFIRINFHAWKYQDTPASWAYLYEAFAKEYFKDEVSNSKFRNKWNEIKKLLSLNYKRQGSWPIIKFVITILTSILGIWLTNEYNKTIAWLIFLGGVSALIIQGLKTIKASFSKEAKELFEKYYNKVSFANLLGTQAEIQKELKLLLKTWIPEPKNGVFSTKILLFVDDIDRCKEERIMEIIDALRVMLEDPEISKRVVVLAAIDERVLKRTIKWKYHDLLDKDIEIEVVEKKLSQTITQEYMDKLFLSGISLGVLNPDERKKILSKYIKNRVYRKKSGTNFKKDEINMEQPTSSMSGEKKAGTLPPQANTKMEENQTGGETINYSEYDLSEEEEYMLSELMESYIGATPRQIRIFYFRYLLARNILNQNSQIGNITDTLLQNVASLLLYFTMHPESKNIIPQKDKITDENAKELNIIFPKNVIKSINRQELLQILEILETVIAY